MYLGNWLQHPQVYINYLLLLLGELNVTSCKKKGGKKEKKEVELVWISWGKKLENYLKPLFILQPGNSSQPTYFQQLETNEFFSL